MRACYAGRAAFQAPAGSVVDGPRCASAMPLLVLEASHVSSQPQKYLGFGKPLPSPFSGRTITPRRFTSAASPQKPGSSHTSFLVAQATHFWEQLGSRPCCHPLHGAAEAREAPLAKAIKLGAGILPLETNPLKYQREFSRPAADPSAADAVVLNGDAPRDPTSLLQQANRLIESLSVALQVSKGAAKLSRPLRNSSLLQLR